jgi:isoleucyl-tRNA synthetase
VIDAEEARKVADDTIKFHSTIGFLCPDPPAKKDLQTRMTPTQTPGETAPPELKKTLTLPRTDFPMKANLPQNEPIRLNQWAQDDLYGQIRAARRGAKRYILHDGPPYANGPIHLGHALNKCLKDFVVKSKTMAGFDSPYVPGWDCHGLPIEIKVDEQLGRKKMEMPAEDFLEACRAYAAKFVELQKSQFERLGVFGSWDKPYLTMSPGYEAATLETFYRFYERGFVYKGLKPVYWCLHDRTALAEAEVEYEMHTSPSVYVRYTLTSDSATLAPALAGKQVWAIIWTTTPWTLPASLAIAFHPEFEYVALETSAGDVYVVAAELAASVTEACALAPVRELARFKGEQLDRSTYRHPFLERPILGVLATYVTAEQGTGAVHTAPAHGADDFQTGVRYGLSAECNVDNAGRLRNGVELWEGKTVFQANPLIIEHLRERGALLAQADVYHSYPHCWRCHNPVIFRATEQWFIGMETAMPYSKNSRGFDEDEDDAGDRTFRERALEQIRTAVTWDPKWGEERIANMIATRPDWCISRQRVWGVPIAVFLCGACHEPLKDKTVNAKIAALVREHGAAAWHTHTTEQILGETRPCPRCGATGRWEKERDILDVWFDSGSSWFAVLAQDAALTVPADLYFEGGDQHRGWFHTSLLTAVGTGENGEAPYRKVATSGWTLDEQGRAMSKSLGNGVDPNDIAGRLGAEIVRLWVASVDFREDVAASENLMQRVADNYRKLRNTFRFLLGNLHGFEPAIHAVTDAELLPLDRYMLARTDELARKVMAWYDAMEFHRVYHAVNEFCIVELSALYLDVLKDRMYTFAPTGVERRSAQTTLWRIAEALVRLVAPVLSFTAEEVWGYLPQVEGREASVHLALFPQPAATNAADPKEWAEIFAVREEALRSLEEARQAKRIGKALEAKLIVHAPAELLALLTRDREGLKELFNVSQVELQAADRLQVETLPADGQKCGRCWNYRTDIEPYGPWPEVCGRCAEALETMGYARTSGILEERSA